MTQTPLEFGAQPDLSPNEEIMVALDLETTEQSQVPVAHETRKQRTPNGTRSR